MKVTMTIGYNESRSQELFVYAITVTSTVCFSERKVAVESLACSSRPLKFS